MCSQLLSWLSQVFLDVRLTATQACFESKILHCCRGKKKKAKQFLSTTNSLANVKHGQGLRMFGWVFDLRDIVGDWEGFLLHFQEFSAH